MSISVQEIEQQLQRILESAAFRPSPQLSRFLRYTIEEAAAGRVESLKESVLGVEACGRTNFDPRYDTVVRSTASRLRNKLAEYYDGPGAEDPLIVEYPRGGYVPVWRRREDPQARAAAPEPVPQERASRPGRLMAVAACVVMAGIVAGFVFLKRESPRAAKPVRFEVRLPDRHVATNLRSTGRITISPDGRMLAASLRDEGGSLALWIHRFETGTWTKIDNTRGALAPFWSPDSLHIGFFQNEQMKRVPVSGSPVQTLAPGNSRAAAATWMMGGKIIYSDSLNAPLRIIADTGGTSETITTLGTDEASHTAPHALPDGKSFLYTALHKDPVRTAIFSVSVASPQRPKRLVQALSTSGYLERTGGKGLLLYASNGLLVGQDFDPATGELGAAQTTISPQVAFYPFGGLADFATARDGTLVFRTGPGFEQRHLVWLDSKGKAIASPSPQGIHRYPDISPDGKRIATELINPVTSNGQLWLMDSPTFANPRKLTTGEQIELGPVWSPDGQRLAYVNGRDVYVREVNSSSSPTRLTSTPDSKRVVAWTPDGKALLVSLYSSETSYDIGLVGAQAGAPLQKLLHSKTEEREPAISPDGRFLAYVSTQSGAAEVYIEPYPLAPTRSHAIQVSQAGGAFPIWSKDGRGLYFTVGGPFRMMVATITNGLPAAPPREAFVIAPYLQRGFGHTRDKTTGNFLFSMPVPESFLSLPTVILNPHAATQAK